MKRDINNAESDIPDILRDFLPEGSIYEGLDNEGKHKVLVPARKLLSENGQKARSTAYELVNKEVPYFKKEFDIPRNFKVPGFLFEDYWNKKIEKHGSIQDALYIMYNFGKPLNNKSIISPKITMQPRIIKLENKDDSLEHKMENMILVGRNIRLPEDCKTDLDHYSALQQTLHSIKAGETSSYSTLSRTLSELKKNWG
tara:strand:+ start:377 stop:973 length:597 start_codon:yes stop_codon:yes gene_type:complete